ncbi:tRNA (adenosine(37)-N6)-threonylcarbamoyltransferase complex ATPase subunit type 1 TsaE [Candidatus Saccharibacteria bacterium]|nr:tRNA (adenosine(37)-N6)-threonylcarbamoyltransferase complex ATPase subunit type 1 TsaE [Candidatus Saccharibacteria bacterium]
MKIASEKEMLDLGKQFAKKCPKVIELIGDVGAGKTTFTRGLAAGLGITEPITSPSFTISKSYALKNGGRLIHYDFYRLPDPGLMLDDLQENLQDPNNIIIVEWGESITDILPENRTKITIKYTNNDSREVIL